MALKRFNRKIRKKLGRYGIVVNGISAGAVATEMMSLKKAIPL